VRPPKPKRTRKKIATEYCWPTVYAVVKASSDAAVKRALERFGVKEW
jgi:hypothetical protein